MDRIKHFLVFFVFLTTIQIDAQQNTSLDESIFLHTNGTTFVTGEALLYKLYCLKLSDKTPSSLSRVAYVELVDENKKSVFKTKLTLDKGIGQGDYFIPTTLKTGNYKLLGYTNWTLNKPVSELFQIDVIVINPYKVEDKKNAQTVTSASSSSLTTVSESQQNVASASNQDIKLNLTKKTFSNRELVDLKIASSNPIFANGNYSLSVKKLDNLPTKNQISATEFSSDVKTTVLDLQSQKVILPELRGEMISGKVTAKNNTDNVENLNIGFSLPGKSYTFKIVKTDSNGNFIFNIDNAYSGADATLQIIDDNAVNYNIALTPAPEMEYSKLVFNPETALSYTMKESLLDRSISSQVENAYYHKKADYVAKSPSTDPFYYPLAKEYILDDYTRFKTLKETITEVATDIYHKQKGDKIYLHVNDPSVFPQLPESALVIIDGLYLENQNELMTYSMKNVMKIEVIVGRYYLGTKSFNGLISFTTFNKDFKSTQSGSYILKTTIPRPQPKKVYNKIDYSKIGEYDRIPDFRNQLFWNPDVKLNNESNNSFYTSDVTGNFEIRLEGFAKNGTPVSIKDYIEVKDSSVN